MATVVLTAVGTILGGPIGGAIGALAGQAIDARLFAPKGRQGPRLSELQVQTSSYGTQIPLVFGTMRVAGTVIWATDLKETKHKSGGGKGQGSATTYTYSSSLAVALSARPLREVRRIWADGKLLRGAAGDFKSGVGAFRLHQGEAGQAVDPLIQMAQGAARAPAHRGIAYAVIEDMQLEDYGNRIPSLTFEVVADEGTVTLADMTAALVGTGIGGDGAAGPAISGYAASGGSVADAIDPLLSIEDRVLRAGGGALALVRGADGARPPLGRSAGLVRAGGRAVKRESASAMAATSVPRRLSLRHYEPARDYQAGLQRAERPAPGEAEEAVELPACLSADDARGLAQAALTRAWRGRARLELTRGWDALDLAIGELVRVEGWPGLWRIERSEWEGMAVRLTLRATAGGTAAALPGDAGASVREEDAPVGATRLALFELPQTGDAPASAPIVVAAATGASARWRSAALLSEDIVTEIVEPIGASAGRATIGTLLTPLPATTAAIFDRATSIDIALVADEGAIVPASEAALLRGANALMIGRELIQFAGAAAIGPLQWRLTGLLRGRRGTEWAMAGHAIGDPVLLLEAERLFALPDALARAGATVRLRAIGVGDAVPATATIDVRGTAASPLAPVRLGAATEAGGAIVLGWTRRSRAGWGWADGTDAPLGEESERYALTLTRAGVVVRTAETTAPGWRYEPAMQAADGYVALAGPWDANVRQVGAGGAGVAAALRLRP